MDGDEEVKFTTYNLDVEVGDTIKILDYIEPTNLTLGAEYQLYYEDSETWHLQDFNANAPAAIQASDLERRNHGEKENRITMRRVGKSTIDDHMTIRLSGDHS